MGGISLHNKKKQNGGEKKRKRERGKKKKKKRREKIYPHDDPMRDSSTRPDRLHRVEAAGRVRIRAQAVASTAGRLLLCSTGVSAAPAMARRILSCLPSRCFRADSSSWLVVSRSAGQALAAARGGELVDLFARVYSWRRASTSPTKGSNRVQYGYYLRLLLMFVRGIFNPWAPPPPARRNR